MKSLGSCLLLSLVGSFAFAQTEKSSAPAPSTTKTTMVKPTSTSKEIRGFHFEISRPNLELEFKSRTGSGKADSGEAIALFAGYKLVRQSQAGFKGGFTMINMDTDQTSGRWTFVKLDGNVTLGLNDLVFVYGGLNISEVQNGPSDVAAAVDRHGFGSQFGLGIQLNKNFAIDLKRVSMRQEGSAGGQSLDLEEKGMELGIGATF